MSYLHPSYPFGGHAGIPIEQPMACVPPMAHPAMAIPMDGYLVPRPPYDMPEYYAPPMPIMEDREEYTENLSRPRLTKEQVDTLEAQFQAHPKPNSNIKRQLAVQTNLSLPRVANWFQNRRAKAKQQKRQEEFERMQREAKEKEEQAKKEAAKEAEEAKAEEAKAEEEKPKPESDTSSQTNNQTNNTPGQEKDQTSTPKQASATSASNDQVNTPASSSSQSKHQRTSSEAAREATFASLQRALNQAVAARDQFTQQADGSVIVGSSDMPLSLPTSTLPPAGNGPQNSLNAPFSEWGSTRDSSIAWTSSQSPENGFEFGSFNAMQFASTDGHLTAPPLESPQNPDMTGTDAFGNAQLSHQSQAWDGQLHGQTDALPEGQPGSESMYGSLQFSSLQPPADPVARRASSSEELTESMGNIGLTSVQTPPQSMQQLPDQMDGPVWRRPEKELDIAARRKRPRPAAIGTSSSTRPLVGPSSMSPTTRIPSFGGVHPLRHAKSSHALGSRYAGVRKISAPPRSPLGFSSFAEATSSDAKRRLQTSASAGNLAPPTPLTPEELQHLLPSTPRENQNQYSLSAPHPAEGQLFPTAQPMQISVASPPATPMSVDLLSQFQYQNLAPPMSAPAHYSSFPEYSQSSSAPLTGVSWADMQPIPSPDTSSFQSNMQMHVPAVTYEQDVDQDSQTAPQWPMTDASPVYGTAKDSNTPPPATVVINEDQKVPQFHIHEFPQQQEAHRSVAQQLPPQKPKNYTFSHQTPSDF
ncbi:hypothetical protein VTN77DRAFT_4413 [Rasamsonia byssochlamydoides]|uniref:uncharacterized protein n=1 Tax=Rasamsonia byssochlamydoides TaxID=89139 RepID=UPI00374481FB